ncbi:hypothetical protein HK097_008932 [Rhizophlyctis rosea]|uniref:Uncharacterized protein n=1 Tax=Rhizophlyctis rosea TaxID=64517 RepID=A0AAD5SHQ1_9FUNG|nr:hypothetical protein HK097_008932 [Rhizophlyctis rosea]
MTCHLLRIAKFSLPEPKTIFILFALWFSRFRQPKTSHTPTDQTIKTMSTSSTFSNFDRNDVNVADWIYRTATDTDTPGFHYTQASFSSSPSRGNASSAASDGVLDINVDFTPLAHGALLDGTKDQVRRADELISRAQSDIQDAQQEVKRSEDRSQEREGLLQDERRSR